MLRTTMISFLFLTVFLAHSQIASYDSLAASDTLNWPQMQYLDSLMQRGARWQEHTEELLQLGVMRQVQETAQKVPDHITKLDSLLQEKSDLMKEKILSLSSNTQKKIDSAGQALPFGFNQYTSKMAGPASAGLPAGQAGKLDQLIDRYSSQLSDRKERSWLQDHLGQLQQMDGVLDQYQGKLLDMGDLEQLKGYQQQLQQLTGQSQGYFQEAKGLLKGELNEEHPLMQKLQSLIGNRKEFQELQAQTAELEQFKQLASKYGEDYAREHRQ